MIGSSHRRRAKSPLGTVLIINLLGKGLTPRACMGDGDEFFDNIPLRILLDALFRVFRFSKASFYALTSSFMTF